MTSKNVDELLKKIRVQESPKETTVIVQEKPKSRFSFSLVVNILLLLAVLYLVFIRTPIKNDDNDNDDVIVNPVVNIVEETAKYENLYSSHKATIYLKLSELVKDKTITDSNQLMKNAQAALEKAREVSLGKIDQLDNENLKDWSDPSKISKYLEDKAKGFEKASK
jgi:hypothetical protein